MKEIKRNLYLQKFLNSRENGMIKVITGIRRCGKSYLLDPIYKNYLIGIGIPEDHIIKLDLDERKNKHFLDPDKLDQYVRTKIIDDKMHYLILDEIQLVKDFESVLNGFLHIKNIDIYVTGSNSKFLSSDIITEFRGRGEQIRIYPLSFSEFYQESKVDKLATYQNYITYGGMPLILSLKTDEEKSKYLKDLFELTYFKDIIDRNGIHKNDILESLVNALASSVGSLTNPTKLINTFQSKGAEGLSKNTIIQYLSYLLDSFLVEKIDRYDVKGKKYIHTPSKYYFCDIGLRNARLNFRQQEENHIMENVIYNELVRRGYNVDVGVVEVREKDDRKQLEVDFVCNQYHKRYYVQVALNLETREKTIQEERPLMNIKDYFKKIIVVKDIIAPWITEEGIHVIGVIDFLLNENSMDE